LLLAVTAAAMGAGALATIALPRYPASGADLD
jgi:hypothetical protein